MRKVAIIMSIAIISIASITLISCEKSSTEPVAPTSDNSNQAKFLTQSKNVAFQHALAAYAKTTQSENGNLKSGAEFIVPFFDGELFGVGKSIKYDENYNIISGELAFFFAPYGKNDFYRQNPDGTVSVQLASSTGDAFYQNFNNGYFNASGENFNIRMKYTGTVIEESFEWDGVIYTFKFIDTQNNPNAIIWNATGKVQVDGTGPMHSLLAHVTYQPDMKDKNVFLKYN